MGRRRSRPLGMVGMESDQGEKRWVFTKRGAYEIQPSVQATSQPERAQRGGSFAQWGLGVVMVFTLLAVSLSRNPRFVGHAEPAADIERASDISTHTADVASSLRVVPETKGSQSHKRFSQLKLASKKQAPKIQLAKVTKTTAPKSKSTNKDKKIKFELPLFGTRKPTP